MTTKLVMVVMMMMMVAMVIMVHVSHYLKGRSVKQLDDFLFGVIPRHVNFLNSLGQRTCEDVDMATLCFDIFNESNHVGPQNFRHV